MCQWDVTHGRRRYAKVTSFNSGADVVILPNKFRVAIMFGAAWLAANEVMTIATDNPEAPGIAITTLNNNQPHITFNIETYGSLVMDGFTINKTGVGVCTVTEILVQQADHEQLQF